MSGLLNRIKKNWMNKLRTVYIKGMNEWMNEDWETVYTPGWKNEEWKMVYIPGWMNEWMKDGKLFIFQDEWMNERMNEGWETVYIPG